MALKIMVTNKKGGIGKTTTTINLADILKYTKNNVLVVDLDSQCSATDIYDPGESAEYTLYDIYAGNCSAEDAIYHTERMDIIVGDVRMDGIGIDNLFFIKEALSAIEDNYDFIIFDTHPAVEDILICGMIASDGLIVPVEPAILELNGTLRFIKDLYAIQEKLNNNCCKLYGLFLNEYSAKTNLSKDTLADLPKICKNKGIPFFATYISDCQDIANAQAYGKTLIEQNKYCEPVKQYSTLIREILSKAMGD